MKQHVSHRVCSVLLVGAMLLGCRPRTVMADTDAEAIRDTVLRLETAMNQAVDGLNCQKGLSYVGDQPPVFVSGGHVVRTHAQLLSACENLVAPRTGAVFATDTVTAYALSADAAYVVREGQYTVSYRDGRVDVEHLVMTTIWERQGGIWRMVHLHESAVPRPESAAGKAGAR